MTPRGSIIIVAVVIGFILLATFSWSPVADEEEVRLVVLATGNLQSRVFPPDAEGGSGSPGLAAIAATAGRVRPDDTPAILVSGGDDLTGALYALFGGEPEYRGMTAAGYDAACPGNHEFDFGYGLYAGAVRHAGFPIVSANLVLENENLREAIRPWTIVRRDGVTFGIFGLMTPALATIAPAGPGVTVTDPEAAAEAAVRALRDEGADAIICLSQLGIDEDTRLAGQVEGIHAIIGGEGYTGSGWAVPGPDNRTTVIVPAGRYGEDLGILHLTLRGGYVTGWAFGTVKPSGDDPAVAAVLAPFLAAFAEEMHRPVGEIGYPLDTRRETVRGGEAAAGDLIADAWRDNFPAAEIAFINAGSIRGDRVIPAGPVSWGTMTDVLPYGSELVLVRMNGSAIRETLEVAASALRVPGDEGTPGQRTPTGGFLQVSGIRFEIDRSGDPFTWESPGPGTVTVVSAGNRVDAIEVLGPGGWEDLRRDGTYTVVVNSWLASGGDGHVAIAASAGPDPPGTTVRDIDPVIRAIAEGRATEPGPGMRIRIVDGTRSP